MPEVTNKPSATTFQVGQTVYVPYLASDPQPQAAVVEKTESVVLDANGDGTGEQTNIYYFVGAGRFTLPESKVFVSKVALEAYLDNLVDNA